MEAGLNTTDLLQNTGPNVPILVGLKKIYYIHNTLFFKSIN